MPQCKREQLQQEFFRFLLNSFSDQSVADVEKAASQWVAEKGEFINSIGKCISRGKCERCGQIPFVADNGRIMTGQGNPACEVSARIVHISKFDK